MKIFLSHTKDDIKNVRRISDILKSHGHEPWLDEKEIILGSSVVDGINKGLEEAEIVIVFLSKKSIESTWVRKEWQITFFDHVNKGDVIIIPLLLDDCKIPQLLKDKKYADFRNREEYESNIAELIRSLSIIEYDSKEEPISDRSKESVLEYTKELLSELEVECISFPVGPKIKIIATLKKIKRSGKKVRLGRIKPALQVRSIYDHILSVAHTADCLLPYIDHGLSAVQHTELARIIAFHELVEVVLGDIPAYTNLINGKRVSSRVDAERSLRSVPPAKRERIASDFIWLFLREKQRQSMETVQRYLGEPRSQLSVFFRTLDKIDPIISVWRYLHHYRNSLGDSGDEFFKNMRDFFDNPDVRSYIETNIENTQLLELVDVFQNRALAKEYYKNKNCFMQRKKALKLPIDVFVKIIEGHSLFHNVK